ncbi:MAG: cell surface protein [Deltaproteobacteria bacterium]|nr:cell surface protein [Deltaproteobacteria bacterium]
MRFPLYGAVLALLFFSMAACGGSDDGGDDAASEDDSVPAVDDDDASDDDSDDGDDDVNEDDDLGDDDTADPLEVDPLAFAVEVIDVEYGPLAGFGQDGFPDNVLGPPAGKGDFAPQQSEDEMLGLGIGGWIVVRTGYEIVDGDGPDFIVFENPFYVAGDGVHVFTEAATVEVSDDGVTWYRFPNDYDPDGAGTYPWGVPDNFAGLAGIHPVSANPAKGIDPRDPDVAGGDPFDLADVGLASASYIRLTDAGDDDEVPGSGILDDNGDAIDDWGNHIAAMAPSCGFDLDAVAVIHAGDPT